MGYQFYSNGVMSRLDSRRVYPATNSTYNRAANGT